MTVQVFRVDRHEDETGVSGEGMVGYAVVFPPPNDHAVFGWLTEPSSIYVYDSFPDLVEIHGHDGKTEFTEVPATMDHARL